VKFQAYTPDELVLLRGNGPAPEPWGSLGWDLKALYTHAQTPPRWFPRLIECCEENGVRWFASVFGAGSLLLMEAFGCPAYKLAALDYRARGLRELVQATGKPIIRSWPHERAPKRKGDHVVLYCPPGYPQASITVGKLAQRGFDGFSYHGTNYVLPVAAVLHGARVIEVHIQHAVGSELEEAFSFHMSRFATMVQAIRAAEVIR
jgi:sialic acid synthase SpsE